MRTNLVYLNVTKRLYSRRAEVFRIVREWLTEYYLPRWTLLLAMASAVGVMWYAVHVHRVAQAALAACGV